VQKHTYSMNMEYLKGYQRVLTHFRLHQTELCKRSSQCWAFISHREFIVIQGVAGLKATEESICDH
jgi:hypothetical protein